MPGSVRLYVIKKTSVAAFRYRNSQTELSDFDAGCPISDDGPSALVSLREKNNGVRTPAGALLVRSLCGCKDECFRGMNLGTRQVEVEN